MRQPILLGSGTHYFAFNTSGADGAPITLASGALRVSINGGDYVNAGVTLSVDHDYNGASQVTGLHRIALDIDNGTLALVHGDAVDVILSAGTVDSISRVGTVLWRVIALEDGLTAAVAADVNAQVDAALADYDGVTFTEWDARTPAALVSGRMDASVGAMAANVITAAATAADFGTEVANALLDLANGVETGTTMRQALRAIAAVLAGNASGGPDNSVFDGIGVSTDRVTSVADEDGDRTITLSL